MKDNHGSVKKKYHKAGEDENNDFEAREPIHSLPIAGVEEVVNSLGLGKSSTRSDLNQNINLFLKYSRM